MSGHSEKCSCHVRSTGLEQSLDELDWQRGIWGAAFDGDLPKVKKKLTDLNKPDNYGFTALHYAARQKHKHIVEFLLSDKTIKFNARTNGGCTPLHRAAITGDHSLLNIFLTQKNVDLSATDHEGQNFLHKLAKSRISADILENYFAKFPDQARISDNYSKLPSEYR